MSRDKITRTAQANLSVAAQQAGVADSVYAECLTLLADVRARGGELSDKDARHIVDLMLQDGGSLAARESLLSQLRALIGRVRAAWADSQGPSSRDLVFGIDASADRDVVSEHEDDVIDDSSILDVDLNSLDDASGEIEPLVSAESDSRITDSVAEAAIEPIRESVELPKVLEEPTDEDAPEWLSQVIELDGVDEGAEGVGEYVWPEGLSGAESKLSVLEALASDPVTEHDPWQHLSIDDLRTTGAPAPLDGRAAPAEGRGSDRVPTSHQREDNPLPSLPKRIPTFGQGPGQGHLGPDPIVSQPGDPSTGEAFVASTGRPEDMEAVGVHQGVRASMAVQAVIRNGPHLLSAFTSSIGAGGIFVTTDHLLPDDTIIHLFLEMPSGEAIGVNCEVMWGRPRRSLDAPAGMELRYLDLSDAASRIIEAYIRSGRGLVGPSKAPP